MQNTRYRIITIGISRQVALYDHDFNSTIVKARVRKGCGWLASLNRNTIFGDATTTPTVVSGYFGDMWCMTSAPYNAPTLTADDVKGSDALLNKEWNANIYQSLINARVTKQEQICIYDPCKSLPDNLETVTSTTSSTLTPKPDGTPVSTPTDEDDDDDDDENEDEDNDDKSTSTTLKPTTTTSAATILLPILSPIVFFTLNRLNL